MLIEWKEEYKLGINEIDQQHKIFFNIINDLDDIVVQNKVTKEKIISFYNEMRSYFELHFSTEEKYFKKFKYTEREEHIKAHDVFREKIEYVIENVNKSEEGDIFELAFRTRSYLVDWFVYHILHEDRKYIQTFKDGGVK